MPERPPHPVPSGPFVAVVGPSGAGKDTILQHARARLGENVLFARRVITRPPQIDAEDHDSLDEAAFAAAEREGAFCLSWGAHGLRYGLPSGLRSECAAGRAVIANLSRRVLGAAAAQFGDLHVVEITAPRALLVQRIAARGRESAEEIEARLARSVALELPAGATALHRIENAGTPDEASDRFVALVEALLARTAA